LIVYHVTVKIITDTAAEWLIWMRDVHIPDVMKTGCFRAYRLAQMMQEEEDDDGITFSVQYLCESETLLDRYLKEFAPGLQAVHSSRYKDQFVAYRTMHKVLFGSF
jgi:hypothetical protein